MGSLPDSKYIIQTDGYWFVEAHDVDPSKGYISVSAKGIINGLSNQPNDGADFGPDSYNPNYSGSGIPYTQTSGIAEWESYCENLGYVIPAYLITDDNNAPYKIESKVILNSTLSGWKMWGKNKKTTTIQAGFNSTDYIFALDGINTSTHYDIGSFSVDANSHTFTNGFLGFPQPSEQVIRGYIHDITPINMNAQNVIYGTYSEGCLIERVYGLDNSSDNGSIYWTGVGGELNVTRCVLWDFNTETPSGNYFDLTLNNTFSNTLQTETRDTFIKCYWNSPGSGYPLEYTDTTGADHYVSFISTILDYNNVTTNPAIVKLDSGRIIFTSIDSEFLLNTGSSANFAYTTNATSNDVIWIVKSTRLSGVTPTINVNGTVYPLKNAVSISTNPPVSGTPYQNTNPFPIIIYLPVYTSTSGTAGNVKASIGGNSSLGLQVVNDIVNSGTSSSNPRTIQIKVPAGWYYQFTGTTATFGTATVVAD